LKLIFSARTISDSDIGNIGRLSAPKLCPVKGINTGLAVKLLFVVFMLFSCKVVMALNIPFIAGFSSDGHLDWYPSRNSRKHNWNDKYIITLGVDSLRYRDLEFSFTLSNQAEFTDQPMLLENIELKYHLDNWSITGKSAFQGIGEGSFFSQLYVSDANYNRYMYMQTRFNGIEGRYNQDRISTFLGLGGNPHNLAMSYLGIQYSGSGFGFGFRTDASVKDVHWDGPRITPSVFAFYKDKRIRMQTGIAGNHVLKYNKHPARNEYFANAELQVELGRYVGFVCAAERQQQKHAPLSSTTLENGFITRLGSLEFIPNTRWQLIDNSEVLRIGFLAKYLFDGHNSVGLYVNNLIPDAGQKCFETGIQSSLYFTF
jgi:hypothetical protein